MEALRLSTRWLFERASPWSQRMTLHWTRFDPEVCVASQRGQDRYLQERGKSLLFQGSSGSSKSTKVLRYSLQGLPATRSRQAARVRTGERFPRRRKHPGRIGFASSTVASVASIFLPFPSSEWARDFCNGRRERDRRLTNRWFHLLPDDWPFASESWPLGTLALVLFRLSAPCIQYLMPSKCTPSTDARSSFVTKACDCVGRVYVRVLQKCWGLRRT